MSRDSTGKVSRENGDSASRELSGSHLVRMYPAAYRAAYGREILDVHREMTMDLSRAARLRADADLLAHALRVRLRLDSASPGGRFFALAGPLACGVAAAYGGIHLMSWYAGVAISPDSTWSQVATTDGPQALHVLTLALMCVGSITALLRWWTAGAILAVSGLLGFATLWTVAPALYNEGPFEPIAAALTAAVILASPPDGRLSAVAGAMAAIAWFPVALVQTRDFVVSTDYGVWPLLTAILTGAALALHARLADLRGLGAITAAAPLFLAHAYTHGWLELRPPAGAALALAMPTIAACFLAVRRRRAD